MFNILITYKTGDSFHTEVTQDFVEESWTNINIAAENLERIKQHWQYHVQEETLHFGNKIEKPPFVKKDEKYNIIVLYLKTDEGKEYKYLPFWIGYFERLMRAEISTDIVYEPT